MLFIVSTPIGNLKDITFRAVEVLKSVDLIACEDTRHSRILLEHYGITNPTTSYFEHNKFRKGEALIKLLKEGKDIALITDAGTPGISDPGNLLVAEISQRLPHVQITPIPGACAAIASVCMWPPVDCCG